MKLSFVSTRQAENVQNTLERIVQLPKINLFIGRGQALVKKSSKQDQIIDLINLDPSISKIHASITFSPAWFCQIPFQNSFMSKICLKSINSDRIMGIGRLPEELIKNIYQYWKPRKLCLLTDLKSSLGTFQKISSVELRKNMRVIWGDNRQICISDVFYYKTQDFIRVLQQQQARGTLIRSKVVPVNLAQQIFFSLLIVRHQNRNFALVGKKDHKYVVGRGTSSDVTIHHRQISRKQAIIYYQNEKWILEDGDGVNSSLNGSYLRIQSKILNCWEKYVFKMGRTVIHIDFNSYNQKLRLQTQDKSILQNGISGKTNSF